MNARIETFAELMPNVLTLREAMSVNADPDMRRSS